MSNRIRITLAASTTVVLIGGLTLAGLAHRQDTSKQVIAVPAPRTEVVHKRTVRTVRVPAPEPPRPGPPSSREVSAVTSAAGQIAPRVVQAPRKVSSRVSPVGTAREDEGEHERESEHEGESD